MVKVLFIFSGEDRRRLEPLVEKGEWPDNWFFGYNRVAKHTGIKAEFVQVTKENFNGNFRLFIDIYKQLKAADVIFITSSLHFSLLRVKKFGFLRDKKWIILNLDLTSKLKKGQLKLSDIKEVDKIISPSRTQIKYLNDLGLRDEQLEFVPFGVDKKFYHSLPPTDEGIVFAVGRDPGRDYSTLIEAVRDSQNETVIMCRERNLENFQTKIPANVKIEEERTPLETRDFYAEALISDIPSHNDQHVGGSDCSGQTVILESMGYGRPVIASRKEWFKDYFVEDKHLVIVPPEDPQALRKAIERVKIDKNLRESLVREGRNLIETQYNSDQMGKRFAEIILKLV